MKKAFIFLSAWIVFTLIFALVFTCFSAKDYRVERPNIESADVGEITFVTDNGRIEVTQKNDDRDMISFVVKPLSPGKDYLEIYASDLDGETTLYYNVIGFYCGPFGTIFAMDPALNFSGSGVVIAALFSNIVLTAILTTLMYIISLRRAAFNYGTVACGGIAFFTVTNLALLLLASAVADGAFFINLFEDSVGSFLSGFASFGNIFSMISAPLMAVFSIAVTVSNLVLIRREGFRIVNLLGVILGVLWLAGMAFNYFIDANSSGSSDHGRIFTSISSGIAIVISYFVCMLFSTIVGAWAASRHRPPYDRNYIVILGCAIRSDGSLTPLLRGRVDAALDFARKQREATGKSLKFVPSGGQGSDEVISESEAMRRYLLEQGVPGEQILTEDRSVNTMQNVLFSKKVIEEDTRGDYNAAVATTNYHVFRSYILSQKAGLKNMQGVSAKTKWYFFPNAFLRELAGLIVERKCSISVWLSC